MNELKGKCVNVVLGIREGKGFDFLKKPTYIVASFNGRVMESDMSEINENPCFNTELVWESEKRDVRKTRSTNTPLRIELCTMDANNQKKETIGFTLLSLRSAPCIVNCDTEIPYKWYKLLGIPNECKGTHPELYLSLTLRDHLINNELPRALPYIMEDTEITSMDGKEIVPIRFIQDGYIQIGNDDVVNDTFRFTVQLRTAFNLDLLLPKDLVFAAEIKDKYYLTFVMLGLSLNTKPFYKDLHTNIVLNEKIVLKILSTYDILKDFFDQHAELQIIFNYGQQKLNELKLNTKNFIPDDYDKNSSELIREEIACFPINDRCDRKPSIDVIYALNLIEQQPTERESQSTFKSAISVQKFDVEDRRVRKTFNLDDYTQEIVNYNLYTILITLESIKWRLKMKSDEFNVIFQHPQAKTKLMIKIEYDALGVLNDCKCKMYYVTSSENLSKIIEAWSPTIRVVVSSSNDPYYFDLEFLTKDFKLDDDNNTKYDYVTYLYKNETIVADANVSITIEQLSEPQNGTDYDLFPYILDEEIALREIEDFRKWKLNEKAKYTANLKQRETEFLKDFKKQWLSRKNELEQKLLNNINRCRTLNNQLKRTSLAQKVKESYEDKRDEYRNRENYVFDDEVYKNSLKYAHLTNKELIEKITELKEENVCLQEIIDEQQIEIEKFKKSSLTDEQTGNLLQELRALQEKYEELLKTKNYFKEQWKKSVREIHQLKAEGRNTIKRQIRNNLEDLSHLSLDGFLNKTNQVNKDVVEDDDDGDGDCKDNFYRFCTRKSCSEFNMTINTK